MGKNGEASERRPVVVGVRVLMATALVLGVLVVGAGGGSAGEAGSAEGPSSCFWGDPISPLAAEGANFNWPDDAAAYWLARYNPPAGSELVLRGEYPHARYMSFNAYEGGSPVDVITDLEVGPDAGSTNPFVAGNRRDSEERSWVITVLDEASPEGDAAEQANTLYAGVESGPREIVYRVYVPDEGEDLAGGTGLPEPELVLADGSVLEGEELCDAINDPDRELPVLSLSQDEYEARVNTEGADPATNPAFDPAHWEAFFNAPYALTVYYRNTPREAERAEIDTTLSGGFYSNADNRYVNANISRVFGDIAVLQGRLPTVPETVDGAEEMGEGQVRFWSLCQNESAVTTVVVDCLYDEEVPVDDDGMYTIVVSRPEDRPDNATDECGVGWLDWGEQGDGVGRPQHGLLIMRNMLPDPSFDEAIQNVAEPGVEAEVMGDYLPAVSYSTVADFEARGCEADTEAAAPGDQADGDDGIPAAAIWVPLGIIVAAGVVFVVWRARRIRARIPRSRA